MLNGVILLWFILSALAVAFVIVDIRTTPESSVLKWGFVLLTAYTGVVGAFLYVLGCREPLPGTHEHFVAARWRQTLGSTMHCVAGDGVGILAGAVISKALGLTGPTEIALEYVLGFGFGWTIFQSLFMRDMSGSYSAALRSTFMPEFLSMNLLMAGMVPTVSLLREHIKYADDPTSARFWFAMSMGLLVGFIIAYPMNWWLVANHLKHGMMTIRRTAITANSHVGMDHASMTDMAHKDASVPTMPAPVPSPPIPLMAAFSLFALALGLALGPLSRP